MIFLILIFLFILIILRVRKGSNKNIQSNQGDIYEDEFYFIFPNGEKTEKTLKIKLEYNLDENLINQEFKISPNFSCKNQIILKNKSYSFKTINKEIFNYISPLIIKSPIGQLNIHRNNNKLIGKVLEFSEGVLKIKMKIVK